MGILPPGQLLPTSISRLVLTHKSSILCHSLLLLRCEGNALVFTPLRNSPHFSCLTWGPLLSAISNHCMTPAPEDACCDTVCDKTALKSKLPLVVMKFIFIASHGIWDKKTHLASVWVMQKAKSEKETGGNWYTCYYKTQTNTRETKRLEQA